MERDETISICDVGRIERKNIFSGKRQEDTAFFSICDDVKTRSFSGVSGQI